MLNNISGEREMYVFLPRNGIESISDFIEKSDFKIDGLQANISDKEISYFETTPSEERVVPLSQIVGFSETNLRVDKSYFGNFGNFFNLDDGSQYLSRAIGMLDYSTEEVMVKLSSSFDEEPINTVSIDGKYYISTNGLHRFMALKLYYMLELYQGKVKEELDKKYMIKISNKELNVFKIFTYYFGLNFNPPIKCNNELNEGQWLNDVKERLSGFNDNDYYSFIYIFAFSHFINDASGEVMIKCLFKYFPKIIIDIFEYLIMTNNYECSLNIIKCSKKYYPEYEDKLIQLVNNNLKSYFPNNDSKITASWKYFDLGKKWNGYGKIREILNKQKDSEQFSEGSDALCKCLRIIWNLGMETSACCKGNHLSVNIYNNPFVNCEAYIAFCRNSDWKEYLSVEMINNKEVIIIEDAIYYYGKNSEMFFTLLGRDFLTGKKNNYSLLKDKNNDVTEKMEEESFIYALEEIGFDAEQIEFLLYDYLEIDKCMNEHDRAKTEDEDVIRKRWHDAWERYDYDLVFYINRNQESEVEMGNYTPSVTDDFERNDSKIR